MGHFRPDSDLGHAAKIRILAELAGRQCWIFVASWYSLAILVTHWQEAWNGTV